MISQEYGTLGKLTAKVLVYSSYDEADKAAGKTGAVLELGNDNLYYRGAATEVREIVCDLVEEWSGETRKTKETGKKDAEGKAILAFDESEGEYVSRVMALKKVENLSVLQDKLNAALAAMPTYDKDGNEVKGVTSPLAVDIRVRERKPAGPKKLAQKYKDVATKILAGKNINAFITKAAALLKQPAIVLDADKTKQVDQVGWLVKSYSEAEEANRLAAMVG